MNQREALEAEIRAAEAAVVRSDLRLKADVKQLAGRGAAAGGIVLAVVAGVWLLSRLIPRRERAKAEAEAAPVARASLLAGLFGALWPAIAARLTGTRASSNTDLAIGATVPLVQAIFARRRDRRSQEHQP